MGNLVWLRARLYSKDFPFIKPLDPYGDFIDRCYSPLVLQMKMLRQQKVLQLSHGKFQTQAV